MGSSLDMSRFLPSSCQHVVKRILAYTLLDASYPFVLFFCCGCRHSINIVFACKIKSHCISKGDILIKINIVLNESKWSKIKIEQNLTQVQLEKKYTFSNHIYPIMKVLVMWILLTFYNLPLLVNLAGFNDVLPCGKQLEAEGLVSLLRGNLPDRDILQWNDPLGLLILQEKQDAWRSFIICMYREALIIWEPSFQTKHPDLWSIWIYKLHVQD